MSVVDEFLIWYSGVQSAVQEALSGPIKDGLEQEIQKSAKKNVYEAYSGGGYRRGLIGSPQNLMADVNGNELHIRNVTVQQGSPGRLSETNFVESGDPAYHQPKPRPFMDEALADYANGEGPEDLANALRGRGYTVV